jgi:hypothetical protein
MIDVACFAAITCGVPYVTITSTLSRTNSVAISANRSARPSAQRYSIAKVRPSIQPNWRSRCRKAAIHWTWAEGVVGPKNPMVGSLPAWARAPSGHAAAPPSAAINSRRRRKLRICPSRAGSPTEAD